MNIEEWLTTFGTTRKTDNVVGIDYSTTSPAICVSVNDPYVDSFQTYDIHYLTTKKKVIDEYWNTPFLFFGHELPSLDGIERYKYISSWAIDIIRSYEVYEVYIEDYAYAATGRVFHIGENTGILKYRLNRMDIPVFPVAPTQIKKHATGKGNANKDLMRRAFEAETNVYLQDIMQYTGSNPISDIIDSYYVCTYGEDDESKDGDES